MDFDEDLAGKDFLFIARSVQHWLNSEGTTGRLGDPKFRTKVTEALRNARKVEHLPNLAAIELELGRTYSDHDLLTNAMLRIGASTENEAFMTALLREIEDPALLGHWEDRWSLLGPVVRGVIKDRRDPLLNLIEDNDPAGVDELVEFGWKPNSIIPEILRTELAIQGGWRLTRLARGSDFAKRASSVFASPFFRESLSKDPSRFWEVATIKAILKLLEGDVAYARLLMPRPEQCSNWSRHLIKQEIERFALFMFGEHETWAERYGENHIPGAHSLEERCLRSLNDLPTSTINRQQVTWRTLSPIVNSSNCPQWALLLVLTNPNLQTQAAVELAKLVDRIPDQQQKALPWTIDFERISLALSQLSDPIVAASLSLQLHRFTLSNESGRFFARMLTAVNRRKRFELINKCASNERKLVIDHMPREDKIALNRGGTFRAIIDGSNVMAGGRDISLEGGEPRLQRLSELRDLLLENGFSEIYLFFDNTTLDERITSGIFGRLSPDEKRALKRMVNRGEAMNVPRADPVIVETYLEDPEVSEVISNDNFVKDVRIERKPLAEQLEAIGLRKRGFHLNQDHKIIVRPPLTEAARFAKGQAVWSMDRRM